MSAIERASSIRCTVGGLVDQRGWAVAGPGVELPSPILVLRISLEIEGSDGDGYLLLWDSEDHSIWGRWWCETVALAEEAAAEVFGVRPEQWVTL